jgi:hypothetical protein
MGKGSRNPIPVRTALTASSRKRPYAVAAALCCLAPWAAGPSARQSADGVPDIDGFVSRCLPVHVPDADESGVPNVYWVGFPESERWKVAWGTWWRMFLASFILYFALFVLVMGLLAGLAISPRGRAQPERATGVGPGGGQTRR